MTIIPPPSGYQIYIWDFDQTLLRIHSWASGLRTPAEVNRRQWYSDFADPELVFHWFKTIQSQGNRVAIASFGSVDVIETYLRNLSLYYPNGFDLNQIMIATPRLLGRSDGTSLPNKNELITRIVQQTGRQLNQTEVLFFDDDSKNIFGADSQQVIPINGLIVPYLDPEHGGFTRKYLNALIQNGDFLPPPWQMAIDPRTFKYYYYEPNTEVVSSIFPQSNCKKTCPWTKGYPEKEIDLHTLEYPFRSLELSIPAILLWIASGVYPMITIPTPPELVATQSKKLGHPVTESREIYFRETDRRPRKCDMIHSVIVNYIKGHGYYLTDWQMEKVEKFPDLMSILNLLERGNHHCINHLLTQLYSGPRKTNLGQLNRSEQNQIRYFLQHLTSNEIRIIFLPSMSTPLAHDQMVELVFDEYHIGRR